jgi:hypothetical protein
VWQRGLGSHRQNRAWEEDAKSSVGHQTSAHRIHLKELRSWNAEAMLVSWLRDKLWCRLAHLPSVLRLKLAAPWFYSLVMLGLELPRLQPFAGQIRTKPSKSAKQGTWQRLVRPSLKESLHNSGPAAE